MCYMLFTLICPSHICPTHRMISSPEGRNSYTRKGNHDLLSPPKRFLDNLTVTIVGFLFVHSLIA